MCRLFANAVGMALYAQGVGQGLVASIGHLSQEGTSPPEAAIEATPETTPVKVKSFNNTVFWIII